MTQSNTPRVLIGCPTSYRHKHCIEKFIQALKQLTYPNFDVLFVDETQGEEYADYLRKNNFKVIKNYPQSTAKIGRIIENRNVLISYCINNNYDFMFFLDTDVIPPIDSIEKLIRHNKDITAGIYLANQNINNKVSLLPVLRGLSDYQDYSKIIQLEEIKEDKFFEIFGCGFGCCLIKKQVFEKVKLRFNLHLDSSEDFIFCYDARVKHGFKTFVDTSVKCTHYAASGTHRV